MEVYDIAIIGSGPAGLSAAIEARRRARASVAIVEEKFRTGGQFIKQTHRLFGNSVDYAGIRGIRVAETLSNLAQDLGVEILLNTQVAGLFDTEKAIKTLAAVDNEGLKKILARKVVISTGAGENVAPFPGWTMPGIVTAGAAQTMMHLYRVLPGKRVLVVGTENMGLIVAYQLSQAGAEVVAIIDSALEVRGWKVNAAKVSKLGIPTLCSTIIKETVCRDSVKKATTIRIDENRKEVSGTEEDFDVDCICLAAGLTPDIKLTRMAGCEHIYSSVLGGWIPLHSDEMQTTIEGIYVAGDVSGIEEENVAIEEGKLAVISALSSLGVLRSIEARAMKEHVFSNLDLLRSWSLGEEKKRARQQIVAKYRNRLNMSESGVRKATTQPIRRRTGEIIPSGKRLKSGPVALIECLQDIPCNVCVNSCPSGAIRMDRITDPPVLSSEDCNGCGECIAKCPGLAIFLVDLSSSEEYARISVPYEFLPLPKVGGKAWAVDKNGGILCKALIEKVTCSGELDGTCIVTVRVPKLFGTDVRFIRLVRREL